MESRRRRRTLKIITIIGAIGNIYAPWTWDMQQMGLSLSNAFPTFDYNRSRLAVEPQSPCACGIHDDFISIMIIVADVRLV